MRKPVLVTISVLGALIIALAGAGFAYSAVFPGQLSLSSLPPAPKLVKADTVQADDTNLRNFYGMESTPSASAVTISRDKVLSIARSMYPDYAAAAAAVTARQVKFTDVNLGAMSDSELASMHVPERPRNMDAWLVTFHKVEVPGHGPAGAGAKTSKNSNVVVVFSATTGEFIEGSSYGPVQ